jgi:hypothetical protein
MTKAKMQKKKKGMDGCLILRLGGFICFMFEVALHKGLSTILLKMLVQEGCKGELVRALAQPSRACCKVPNEW